MPNESGSSVVPMTEFIVRNVEAGIYQLVDIAGERKKAKFMSAEEFADKLSGYKLRAYLSTEKMDLLQCGYCSRL